MVAAIVLVAVVAVAGVSIISVVLSRQTREGWLQASLVQREVRSLHIARITTLENRLLSHSWHDFANVQHLPDETAKLAWAEQQFQESQMQETPHVGQRPEDRVATQARSDGSDLEGDNLFEGPTLG